MMKHTAPFLLLTTLLPWVLGCSGSPSGNSPLAGAAPGISTAPEPQQNEPDSVTESQPVTRKDACGNSSGQDGAICLGVKYVSYEDQHGGSEISSEATLGNLEAVNRLWAKCDISFHLADYQSVQPETLGLKMNPANASELTEIRTTFGSTTELLIVTTGNWDRSGTLGDTGANAWTAMPGSFPYGVVLESSVGSFANIMAHELGHYLGLDHSTDSSSLMSPLIYLDSVELTDADCNLARQTTLSHWSGAID